MTYVYRALTYLIELLDYVCSRKNVEQLMNKRKVYGNKILIVRHNIITVRVSLVPIF